MILLFITSLSFAQESEPQIVYKSKTEIDFEGLEIDGDVVKPDGAIIQERGAAKFNPLIGLRTDFNYEMKASINEIK
jgi:hypothetical protein